MAGLSAEALLISALITNGTVGEERSYGISEASFTGFPDEYRWLVNYVATYDSQPNRAIFSVKFPTFIYSEHTDVRSAADAVHHSGNRRRITEAMTTATEQLSFGNDEAAYRALVDAEPRRALAQPKDLLTDIEHLDVIEGYAIEVPFPTLHRLTGGIRAGNLWYVAGRPSQGKSAYLGELARYAVETGSRVLFYSLEMSEAEVRGRFHAAWAQRLGYPSITVSSLRDRRVDPDLYRKFIGRLKERFEAWGGCLHVHTPADGPVSPSVVAGRCGEYDLTVVDYVGLMNQDGGGMAIDDWRVMAKISNQLKIIALANQNARLLCAAQINRDGETGNAPPKVKNLAQSDALGQDGDVVLTMRAKPGNVATCFSLEKNRHGQSGIRFYSSFDPDHGAYAEITADQAEDLVIGAEARAYENPAPHLRVIKSKDEL